MLKYQRLAKTTGIPQTATAHLEGVLNTLSGVVQSSRSQTSFHVSPNLQLIK